jgi:hypothetical protein
MSDLATVYVPVLRAISNAVVSVKLTPEEEDRVREPIVELQAIYEHAANRDKPTPTFLWDAWLSTKSLHKVMDGGQE